MNEKTTVNLPFSPQDIRDGTVPRLVPMLPDTARAEELKSALANAAQAWCVACDAARAAGFEVQASFGPNAFGKTDITQLRLFKTY